MQQCSALTQYAHVSETLWKYVKVLKSYAWSSIRTEKHANRLTNILAELPISASNKSLNEHTSRNANFGK